MDREVGRGSLPEEVTRVLRCERLEEARHVKTGEPKPVQGTKRRLQAGVREGARRRCWRGSWRWGHTGPQGPP